MKAYKTGTWSKEEELFLIENYGKMTVKEVSKCINRSGPQIHNKTHKLRMKGHEIGSNKEVMEREYDFIRENIEKSAKEIATLLNVNVSNLYPKIREIKKEPEIIAKLKVIEDLKKEKAMEKNRIRSKERYWERMGKEINIEREREKERRKARELQARYNKLVSKPVIAGVYKKDLKVKLGQSYRIERVKKSVRDWNEFTGKCIHETKDHVTIKNKTRAETFLKVDFLINEYRIKEVS